MAEYIERAEVLKKFEEIKSSVDITFADALYLDGVMELIDSVPSADVVEVVKCKDCKYSRPMDDIEKMEYYESVIICESFEMNDCATAVYPDDFCSYGERKDKQSET